MITAKQCEMWLLEGNLDKVEEVIRTMDPTDLDSNYLCVIAGVYLDRARKTKPVNMEDVYKALNILLTLEEEMADSFIWNYRMGRAHYYCKNYGLALENIIVAHKLKPNNLDNLRLRSRCYRAMSKPNNIPSFKENAMKAWDEFVVVEKKYLLREGSNSFDLERLSESEDYRNFCVDELYRVISIALPMTVFRIGVSIESRKLVIGSLGG